ncbi:condensation domain-containing protein [Pectobacterium aquaticum]|uniref:condensation domain-containing protein n=1 Tax=Pectobacterium aquaticum TaxID=2204145 RepID=UPI000E25FAAB|nr:condensation domain-containing protein [Pectobacterium aquaticum]UEM39848.1 condensation domain-containing protein [Pectobacterium aquaticum]
MTTSNSLLLRRAQSVQTRLNLPVLRRIIRLPPSITDNAIEHAVRAASARHPLSSVEFSLCNKLQFIIPDAWPIEWNEGNDSLETFRILKKESLRTADVVIGSKKYPDRQIHSFCLKVVRGLPDTQVRILAPHTIVDGYGMNTVVNSFLSLVSGIRDIRPLDEKKEFSQFVEHERCQQQCPDSESSAFWNHCYENYKPFPLSECGDGSLECHDTYLEFSLSDTQTKFLSTRFLRAKASISSGILTIFSLSFSKVFGVDQIAIRMTDNQRRQNNRSNIGAYFAEDYVLFLRDLDALSFDSALAQAAQQQRLSLKYINSFRHFDLPDIGTANIKYHYKKVWHAGAFHPDISLGSNKEPRPIDKLVRINVIPNKSGLRIQVICNGRLISVEHCSELKREIIKYLQGDIRG